MDMLTTKRESGDYLWTSFCKNKTSVKMLSRNGISTSKSSGPKLLSKPTKIICFSDNDVNGFINDAADEMFNSTETVNINDVLSRPINIQNQNVNCKSNVANRTCEKVATLKLSPVKKKKHYFVTPELPNV